MTTRIKKNDPHVGEARAVGLPIEGEAWPERPDLSHDSDCVYRLTRGTGECTCNKDARPEHTSGPLRKARGES